MAPMVGAASKLRASRSLALTAPPVEGAPFRGYFVGQGPRSVARMTSNSAARSNALVEEITWQECQPTQSYNDTFTLAPAAIARLEAFEAILEDDSLPYIVGKLRPFAGDDTPMWAKSLGNGPLSWQSTDGNGTVQIPCWFDIPNFIDGAYYKWMKALAIWLAAHSKKIVDVTIGGAVTEYNEPAIKQIGGKNGEGKANAITARDAGYTPAGDIAALKRCIEIHHELFTPLGIVSSLAMNPWQEFTRLDTADPGGKSSLAPTFEIWQFQRTLMGGFGVWENNSLGAKYVSPGIVESRGGDYLTLYNYMFTWARDHLQPVQFQTMTVKKMYVDFDPARPEPTHLYAAQNYALSVEGASGLSWVTPSPGSAPGWDDPTHMSVDMADDIKDQFALNAARIPSPGRPIDPPVDPPVPTVPWSPGTMLYGANDSHWDNLNDQLPSDAKLQMRRFYEGTWPSAPGTKETVDFARGVVPWVSFSAPSPATILAGTHDATLAAYFAASNKPKLISYIHEVDNGPKYTAAQWGAAHDRIYDIKQANCPVPDQVLLGPCLTGFAFTIAGSGYRSWMRGAKMDFIGTDPYRFGRPLNSPNLSTPCPEDDSKSGTQVGGPLRSMAYLSELIEGGQTVSQYAASLGIPLAVGEYSAHPDPANPTNRPNWMQDSHNWFRANNVIAACMFHAPWGGSGPWFFDRYHTFTPNEGDAARLGNMPADADTLSLQKVIDLRRAVNSTPPEFPAAPTEMARTAYVGTAIGTLVVPVTAPVAVGQTCVMVVNAPALNAATSLSATDTKGNTWTLRPFVANAAPVNGQLGILTCKVTTALTTSDTVSVTSNTRTPDKWGAVGLAFPSVVDGFDKQAVNVGATSTAPTVGPTAAAAQNKQAIIAAFTTTGEPTITGTTMTQLPIVTASPGSTPRSLHVGWAYVDAAGTRSASGTLSGNQAWTGAIVALNRS